MTSILPDEDSVVREVLSLYDLGEVQVVEKLGSGLINLTWKINTDRGNYVLQQINDRVFVQPSDIDENIQLVGDYLSTHHPAYLFVRPLAARNETTLVKHRAGGCFRVFPYVQNSLTHQSLNAPKQAYEAAAQFGKFTRLLEAFETNTLKITLPGFHDLQIRYTKFLAALKNGNPSRIQACKKYIEQLLQHETIVKKYQSLLTDPQFKLRVTHYDTKISNVLFDKNDEGICIIDLDTIMPGYFISDVGDMMRTYVSQQNEEETEFDAIEVRPEFYQAVVTGYKDQMNVSLTQSEQNSFFYSAQFIIYMQAIRFFTDYFEDDRYYGRRYDDHNKNRGINQLTLLARFNDMKKKLLALQRG